MKTSELFRKTLKEYLDKQGHGAQARLADELGMDRNNFNGFLNGRKMISEAKREEIAEKIGYSYIDFLNLGREMFNEYPNIENNQEYKNEYVFIPSALEEIVCIVEELITMFEPEISVNLSPKIKAKIIINLYSCIFNNGIARVERIHEGNPHIFNEDKLIKSLEIFDKNYNSLDGDYEEKLLFKAEMIVDGYIKPENVSGLKAFQLWAEEYNERVKKQQNGKKEESISNTGKGEDE